jgi:hypothetical protein
MPAKKILFTVLLIAVGFSSGLLADWYIIRPQTKASNHATDFPKSNAIHSGASAVLGRSTAAGERPDAHVSVRPPATNFPPAPQSSGNKIMSEREARLAELVGAIQAGDIPKALALFEQGSLGSARYSNTYSLFTKWGQLDPTAAIAYAAQRMTGNQYQQQAVNAVLAQWARQDLAAATAWVQQMQRSPLRNSAWNEIIRAPWTSPASFRREIRETPLTQVSSLNGRKAIRPAPRQKPCNCLRARFVITRARRLSAAGLRLIQALRQPGPRRFRQVRRETPL